MTDDAITRWHFTDVPNPAQSDFHYTHDRATSAAVTDTSAHQRILRDFEHAAQTGSQPLTDGRSAKATSG
ncbi:MAG: hypothetical protein IPK21_23455 [Haliscomenobacter sp.]|nr:hypothetical protein [Haliscomenobacter sp.]